MRSEEGKRKQAEYQARHDKECTRRLSCKLNIKTDADILSWLDQLPNKQGYVKQLIRDDIARNQNS